MQRRFTGFLVLLVSIGHGRAEQQPIAQLLKSARTGHPYDRGRAIAALGKSKDKQAIPVLAAIMKAGKPAIRMQAVEALAALGDEKAIFENIPPLLDDPSTNIRYTAAVVLSRQIRCRNKPALLEALSKCLKDEDPAIRRTAIETLRKLGTPGIGLLAKALSDPDEGVAQRALSHLVRYRRAPTEAVPALLKLVQSETPRTRADALRALSFTRSADALPAVLKSLSDESELVRAAGASAAAGYPSEETASSALVRLLAEDSSDKVREAAAGALRSKDKAARSALVSIAVTESEALPVRVKALGSLGVVGGPTDRPFVECLESAEEAKIAEAAKKASKAIEARAAKEEPPPERAAGRAAQSRKDIAVLRGDPGNAARLLRHTDPNLRLLAAQEGARKVAFSDERSLLFEALEPLFDDPDPFAREAAKQAAGKLLASSTARDRDLLEEALKHDDTQVRLAALQGLRRGLGAAAIPTLGKALRDRSEQVRQEAARQTRRLAEQGSDLSRDGLRALVVLLEDSSEAVRYQARGALRAASGMDFRFDVRRWKDWLKSQESRRGQVLPLHPVTGVLREETTLEPVGQILLPFGTPRDVVLRGKWAYVATGEGGVAVYDVSKPSAPRLADRYVTRVPGRVTEYRHWARYANGVCHRLALAGNRLYFMASYSGFAVSGQEITVLDISQAGRVRYLGCLPPVSFSEAHAHADIAAKGQLVYAVQGKKRNLLAVFDFEDPERPERKGAFKAQDSISAFAMSGTYAILGLAKGGLRVVDVRDPENMQARDFHPVKGKAAVLSVQGRTVIAGTDQKELLLLTLQRDTLSDPRSLTLSSAPVDMAGDARQLLVSTADGIQILDLSKPAQPKLLAVNPDTKGGRIHLWRNSIVQVTPSKGIRLLARKGTTLKQVGEAATLGDARDVEHRDGWAFLAQGPAGLGVLDIRKPEAPSVAAGLHTEGFAYRLALRDNLAFVAAGEGGLALLDVTEPKTPVLKSRLPIESLSRLAKQVGLDETALKKAKVRDVHVANGVAYLAVNPIGLVAVDLSDLSRPKPVGAFRFSDDRATPRAVYVEGKTAFVACGRAGLYLVDVSDPAKPQQLSWFWDHDGHRRMGTWDVKVRDGRAYLADADVGFLILDVSDPKAPKLIGRSHTGNGHQVALRGSLAVIADGGYGLRLFDITDPAAPRDVGAFHHERILAQGLRFLDDTTLVAACGWELRTFRLGKREVPLRTAFALNEDGSARPLDRADGKALLPEEVSDRYGIDLNVFDRKHDVCGEGYPEHNNPGQSSRPLYQDLSDAAGWPNIKVRMGTVAIDPRLGRVKFPDGDRDPCRIMGWEELPMGICHTVRKSGKHVFMSDEEGWNIVIWDVSDPFNPKRKGLACTGGFCIGALWVQGNLLLGGNNMGRFTIFDISDIEKPTPVGWFRGNGRCVVASRNYAFDVSGKLVVWDISDPRSPKKVAESLDGAVGFSMTGSHANPQVTATDDYLVGAAGSGLRVLDVKALPELKLLADHPIPVRCLELKGDRLYVGHGNLLQVFDFRDPKRPALLGRCYLPWGFNALTVEGGTLYTGGHGVQVVDISNPEDPRLLGSCGQLYFITGNTAQNTVHSIVANGDVVYTAQPGWGLAAFDVSDKANPEPLIGDPLETLAMGGDFTGIAVRGNFAFSANNWCGVRVVDISDPERPRHIFNTKLFDSGAALGVAANDELFAYHAAVTGMMVFDYSDPQNIREVGRPQPQPQPPPGSGIGGSRYVCLRGNYLYSGYEVMDLAYPFKPTTVAKVPGSLKTGLSGRYLCTKGMVIDVGTPWEPKVVAKGVEALHGGSPWYGRGFHTTRDLAFSSTRAALLITDITDPARPRLLSQRSIPHMVVDVCVQGHYAYVSTYYGGVEIVDVSDPARPKLVDHFEYGPFWDFGGWDNLCCYQSAAIDGEYLCANEYYSGLHVIDVPTAPIAPKGKLTARVFVRK